MQLKIGDWVVTKGSTIVSRVEAIHPPLVTLRYDTIRLTTINLEQVQPLPPQPNETVIVGFGNRVMYDEWEWVVEGLSLQDGLINYKTPGAPHPLPITETVPVWGIQPKHGLHSRVFLPHCPRIDGHFQWGTITRTVWSEEYENFLHTLNTGVQIIDPLVQFVETPELIQLPFNSKTFAHERGMIAPVERILYDHSTRRFMIKTALFTAPLSETDRV